jgi:hypothetical protein
MGTSLLAALQETKGVAALLGVGAVKSMVHRGTRGLRQGGEERAAGGR